VIAIIAPAAPASIRLPLGRPASSSYLFLAYPLAILASRGRGESWLHEHFVQLYHTPSRGLKVYTHPHCTSTHMAQVYDADFTGIAQQLVDPRQLQGDPLHELQKQLSQGVYPQVDVDMGRLGLTRDRRPFLHEILLCGHDSTRFEVLAFDTGGRLRRQWIEATSLAAALDVDGGALLRTLTQEGETVPAWLRADWCGRPQWILHEPTRHVEEGVDDADPARVLQELAHYVTNQPAADLPEARSCADTQLPADTRWGHGAQSGIIDAMRQPGTDCPMICLRLWWEHKRLMAHRLRWLAQLHGAPSFAAKQMEVLARRAGALRMSVLRHERQTRRAVVASPGRASIADGIEAIGKIEEQLLSTLFDQVQSLSGSWVKLSEAGTP
jgi:hypothetical protein